METTTDALLDALVKHSNMTHPERPARLMVRGYMVVETYDGTERYVTVHPSSGLRGWEYAGLHTWVSDQADAIQAALYPDTDTDWDE